MTDSSPLPPSTVIAAESSAPWLRPYLPLLQQIARAPGSLPNALNTLRTDASCPVRFVDQSQLPPDEAYESFIARTGCVPTRGNLHDLFNAVMWLRWPKTKQRLNVLQAAEIARLGVSGARGMLRDALTVFDENAALLCAPRVLVDALRVRNWRALLVEQRAVWPAAQLVLFGHALLEKLMQPRKAITAHVWIVPELTDAAVATSLTVELLTSKLFLPLPVLGVPGWWQANEHVEFYDDPAVFRPR